LPTIDVDCCEFGRLLDWSWQGDLEKLDWLLAFVKSEVKLYNEREDIASIELKDTGRPDLWSVEGLSRTLRTFLNLEKGYRHYEADAPTLEVNVDPVLKAIRPYICCSVVKEMKLTDAVIRGLMHLQDKLDQTYGRNRQKTSIGIYNYDLISPPLSYSVAKPDKMSFVPLGFDEEMNLREILLQHPKGVEYGHIVKGHRVYPILLDAERKVLSFPPIINSNNLGRVTDETKNLLVEVTGTDHQTVLNTLNLVTLALIDRGGKAYSTRIRYPNDAFYSSKQVLTPDFHTRKMVLNVAYANNILGLQLSSEQIVECLLTAGLGAEKVDNDNVSVLIPCYRVDVMHTVDLVEDIAIAYGYSNIEPLWRELPSTGSVQSEQRLIDISREFMVGLGFQEVLNYTLTNPESLFDKMNRQRARIIEIVNPKVITMSCLRSWLLPSLMEFFGSNQSIEFPQKVFELGKVTIVDETQETKTRDEEWLAAATTHPTASFTEIKSILDAFFMNLGLKWQIEEIVHPSFIEGRIGKVTLDGIDFGILGEIHPEVLEAWKLENPVAVFEINILKIIETNFKM